MMIGEFDYGSLFEKDGEEPPLFEASTYVLFVFFLILMAIIVMNLLVRLVFNVRDYL